MIAIHTKGIGGHHHANRGRTDDWITPRSIIDALGPFDLDPCAHVNQPWPCAAESYTDRGLVQPWHGRVWLNPPYGRETKHWLMKMAKHGNGIAIVFARTETKMFFDSVWDTASAMLFMRGRVTFHHPDGSLPRLGANSGGPSVLIAYGLRNAEFLRISGIRGAFVNAARIVP